MNACRGCKYFCEYYGRKDKKGRFVTTGNWCVKRNGKVKKPPKQCKDREGDRLSWLLS